jgi:hypothetical protein
MADQKQFLLGPIIRMRELTAVQLPEHDALQKYQHSAPVEITRFVSDALTEGRNFMKDYLPTASKVVDPTKASPPATATVEVRHHKVHKDLPEAKPVYGATSGKESHSAENWFGRTSIHENASKEGTASWQECYDGLKSNHSLHEVDYTPDCINAHKVLDWKSQLAAHEKIGEWEDVTMELMQMTHKLPFPLNKRLFTVLVITAKLGENEFIVLQIPADSKLYEKVPAAKNPDDVGVPGIYCSIEWVQILPDGKIKWEMSTASDAKGILPMIAQKPAMPQAVAQDVGLFMDWCEKKRKGTAQVSGPGDDQ